MNAAKIPVSVLIQTKNEAIGITACIEGLRDFAEVIVVDSNSTDATPQIAREAGAEVVNFTWDGSYPKKKQWQLDHLPTTHEWVFFIDADETPRPELVSELRNLFSGSAMDDLAALDVDLDYVFARRVLKHGHRVTKRCIVHRSRVRFPEMSDLDAPGMGELEGHYQPEVFGKTRRARGRILHNDLDPVDTWFARHNKYSSWEAHLKTNEVTRSEVARRRTVKGRIFDAVPFKPFLFFVYAYVARAGFLDGRPGFDYAFALSSYYWQIGLKYRELRDLSVARGVRR
ncbi:glycosyltransferase family 2 protein [Microbacterium enclense]|uniref:glycosyltransferase family 2 protein n=1 Tax=Microbacterium enclense TaxID=993073 RepID=UPI003F7E8CAE